MINGKLSALTETNIKRMLPKEMQAVKDSNYLQEVIGFTTYITCLVESDNVTRKETLSWLSEVETIIKNNFNDVVGVSTLATTLQEMEHLDTFTDQDEIDRQINSIPDSLIGI